MAEFRDLIQYYKKVNQKGQLVPVRITMTFDAYVDEVVEKDLKESDVERIELR